MSKKVTVTIPSYRQPHELTRALHALSLQTFKDFEVIIIDDHSGTDLQSVIKAFTENMSVTIHRNEKNLGAMRNLEFSINYPCDSEYVISHHEDDYLAPNYLETAIALLDKNSDLVFVTCKPHWIERNDPYEGKAMSEVTLLTLDAYQFMTKSLKREPFMFGSVVYRRSYLSISFDHDSYYTLCDKIFLHELLLKSKKLAGYIPSPGIYVTDHAKEAKDIRSTEAKPEHLINYFLFYRKHMENTRSVKKIITNSILLGFINIPGKHPFYPFLKTIYKKELFYPNLIDIVGLFSVTCVFFGKKRVEKIIALFRNKRYYSSI